MADTVVEFINVTGEILSQLQVGVTVVTNSASETAVVRDVVITNPNSRPLVLSVGASIVATAYDVAAKLTGSELIGSSSSLMLKTTISPIINQIIMPDGSNYVHTNTLPTQFTNEASGTKTVAGLNTTLFAATAFSSSPNFYIQLANGNVYYAICNSGNTSLYRRAGSANGTETNFATFGSTICYDGVRYIYGLRANTLKTFDTQTNTVTTTVTSAAAAENPSYSQMAAMDGFIFLRHDYTAGVGYIINPTTGAAGSFSITGASFTSRFYVGINKDSSGNYWCVTFTNSAPYTFSYNLGPTLSTTPAVLSTISNTNNPSAYFGNTNLLFRLPGIINYLFVINAGYIYALNITTGANDWTRSLSTYNNGGYAVFPVLSSSLAASDFGVVGVRATGIKTT